MAPIGHDAVSPVEKFSGSDPGSALVPRERSPSPAHGANPVGIRRPGAASYDFRDCYSVPHTGAGV